MRDICFTKPKTCLIQPEILGKSSVQGLLLYQKIVVLLLSSQNSSYRSQTGTNLVDLLGGANTPADVILTSLGTIACNQIKAQLDSSDAQLIQSLTAEAQDGHLSITLVLDQNESYTGVLT